MTISISGTHANVNATSAGVASVAVDLPVGGYILASEKPILIARIALNNSGTAGAAVGLTVSDARSGSWNVMTAANRTPGNTVNDGMSNYLAFVTVTTNYSNGDDVTFSFSPNVTGYAIVIEEWLGLNSTPWLFEVQSATGGSGTPSVGITPGVAGVLVYGSLAIEGGGTDTYTEDADTTDGTWTSLDVADRGLAAANGIKITGAYKIVTGTTAQTWNPTITSRDWAQQIAIFHPADVLAQNVAVTTVVQDAQIGLDAAAEAVYVGAAAQDATVTAAVDVTLSAAVAVTTVVQDATATTVEDAAAAAEAVYVGAAAQDATASAATFDAIAEAVYIGITIPWDSGIEIELALEADAALIISMGANLGATVSEWNPLVENVLVDVSVPTPEGQSAQGNAEAISVTVTVQDAVPDFAFETNGEVVIVVVGALDASSLSAVEAGAELDVRWSVFQNLLRPVFDEIVSPTSKVLLRVDIYEEDGVTPWMLDVPSVSWSVTVDSTRQERRAVDMQLGNTDASLTFYSEGFWYDKVIKVFRGVLVEATGLDYIVQVGEFLIDDIAQDNFPSKVLHVTGRDYAAKLITDKFSQPTTFSAGQHVEDVIRIIATNGFINKFRFDSIGLPLGRDYTFDADSTRWDAIEELAVAFGCEVFFDATGYLVLRRFRDPAGCGRVATFTTGVGGNLVTFAKRTGKSNLANHVVVIGESAGNVPVYVEVENNDPSSPTSINRLNRRVTYTYKSSLITDEATALDVAHRFLAVKSLQDFDVDLTALVLPWLEGGDVVDFRDPDPNPHDPSRYLLSNFTIPSKGPSNANVKRVTMVA